MKASLHSRLNLMPPTAAFVLLLAGLWLEARGMKITQSMGATAIPAFCSFALLLAPLWFFAFGTAEAVRARLQSKTVLTLAPAALFLPYLLYSIPLHEFQLRFALALSLLPVGLGALLLSSSRAQRLLWQDVIVLLALAFTLELGLLSGAWPRAGLGSLPKLYLADVALYLYLVARPIHGMGYSFQPHASAFLIAMREWIFYAPFAFGLGFLLHFIRFFPRVHSV